MGTVASQITSPTIVYSTVYSDTDQRKHQSSASLAFVWGIHRGPVDSPHKWPVTRKMFPFDDVLMSKHIGLPLWWFYKPFSRHRIFSIISTASVNQPGIFIHSDHQELCVCLGKKNTPTNRVLNLLGRTATHAGGQRATVLTQSDKCWWTHPFETGFSLWLLGMLISVRKITLKFGWQHFSLGVRRFYHTASCFRSTKVSLRIYRSAKSYLKMTQSCSGSAKSRRTLPCLMPPRMRLHGTRKANSRSVSFARVLQWCHNERDGVSNHQGAVSSDVELWCFLLSVP